LPQYSQKKRLPAFESLTSPHLGHTAVSKSSPGIGAPGGLRGGKMPTNASVRIRSPCRELVLIDLPSCPEAYAAPPAQSIRSVNRWSRFRQGWHHLRRVGSAAPAESADGEWRPHEGALVEPPIAMVVRTCDPAGDSRNTCHTGTTCTDGGFDTRTRAGSDAFTCFASSVRAGLHPSDGGKSNLHRSRPPGRTTGAPRSSRQGLPESRRGGRYFRRQLSQRR